MKKTNIAVVFLIGLIAMTGFVSAYQGDYTKEGPNYSEDRHAEMEEVFDSLDYDAWIELMSESGRNPRVLDVVSEENFETFVLAHEAAENGDYETATRLRAELGLHNGEGPKDGTGFGNKMRQKGSSGRGFASGNGPYER
ncbi:hypothetical protein HOG16_02505 [Candidatus Woesearchaeota archaeon]|jgi:hypothetical protein|nr:hypothetical protein [Candidatus Woesearchaeota archaeon]MBT4321968.1 hypothetical protein [Candidatus Woesearchaeota archaeon]MBT4631320.1 hypothetical protein [Candidatus Woesearchaeota archaeon]